MQLNHDYSPARIPPATDVLAEMYHSPALYNEGLLSFEYPLYRATDEELDHFLGSLVRSATKAVGGVAKTAGSLAKQAGKALSSVQKLIPSQVLTAGLGWTPMGMAVRAGMGALTAAADGKNVFQSAMRSLANDPVSRFYVDTAAAAARGENILKAAQKAAQAGIGDLRQSLQFAAMVAPFIPGVGTGVAAALGAANALASGQPITEALIAAARSAIPGGAVAQMAFDTAVSVARGKNISDALLNSARSQLPGGPAALAAFDAALALAKGKKIQDAAFAAAGRLLPPSPYAADALAFVKKVAAGENIQRAALSTAGNAVLSRIERQTRPILSGVQGRITKSLPAFNRGLRSFPLPANIPAKWPGFHREAPYAAFGSGEGPLFEQTGHAAPHKEKVSDTAAIPFRWVCKVLILRNGRYESGGSGVLISDRHVLTAAHVVYDANQNTRDYEVKVALGLSINQPLSTAKVDVASQYRPNSSDFDYAIITLRTPVADKTFSQLRGNKLCFWGSSVCGGGTTAVPVEPRDLVVHDAFTAGYPRNQGGSEMWTFSGILAQARPQSSYMVYTGVLTEGQSGSPVWIRQGSTLNLVGIALSRGSVNRVSRLTWGMVAELNGWMLAAEKHHELPQEIAPPTNRFSQLVRSGQATTAIAEAVKSGSADVNQLTNMVFFARHPELAGRKIRPDERTLAQEWLQIRDTIVRPALALVSSPAGSPATVTQPGPFRLRTSHCFSGSTPMDLTATKSATG